MRTFGHLHNRSSYRGRAAGQMGVPGYFDAGDGQGTWNASMAAAEGERRRAAQAAAAATAEANMQTKINAITSNGALTQQQKYGQLGRLVPSGYSRAEERMLQAALKAASV